MIHSDHSVPFTLIRFRKKHVSRERTVYWQPRLYSCLCDGWTDKTRLFFAEHTLFTRMRIQACNNESRFRNTTADQCLLRDTDNIHNPLDREMLWHVSQWNVICHKRDRESDPVIVLFRARNYCGNWFRSQRLTRTKHHYCVRCVRKCSEHLRVSRIRGTRPIYGSFTYWSRRDSIKLSPHREMRCYLYRFNSGGTSMNIYGA